MKKCAHSKMSKGLGLLFLRLAVGSIFMVHGYQKLTNIDMVAGFFSSLHLPMANALAYLVGLVEFVGGAMVLLGVMTCVASSVLAIVMLVAIFTAHLSAGLTGPMGKELPLALLGGLCALIGAGSGKFAVLKAMSCGCGNKEAGNCCSGDKKEACGEKCEDKDGMKDECGCGGNCGCGDKK